MQPLIVRVKDLTGVVAVAAGYASNLAVLKDGSVVAWGLNQDGQLGDGTTIARDPVVKVVSEAVVPQGLVSPQLEGLSGPE